MAFEGIKKFFSNNFETNTSLDSDSTTHYYASDYNHTKDAVIAVAKKMGYDVMNIDDKYKEILFASRRHGEVIVTIATMSFYENAVDMKVSTHYFIARGRAEKIAIKMYNEINRLITLKRKGGVADEYNL